jgi:hypothetical protein
LISVENIPDSDLLYYRIHMNLFVQQKRTLNPSCFHRRDGEISTNWSKYSTPKHTRAGINPARAAEYGIVQFQVQSVRAIPAVSVEHVPIPENPAHACIRGVGGEDELWTQQRFELYRACGQSWLIEPGAGEA